MPRPFPGGKSTCVGSTSRSGELNVPTYAISGDFSPAACAFMTAASGALPAITAEHFRNERREISGDIERDYMVVLCFTNRSHSSDHCVVTLDSWIFERAAKIDAESQRTTMRRL